MTRSTNRISLRIERLELRDTPTASMDPATGVITIVPDSGPGGSNEVVYLSTFPGFVHVKQNGVPYDFAAAQATAIQMNFTDWLLVRDSTIYLESVLASTPVDFASEGWGNSVHLSPFAHDLDSVAGQVAVGGHSINLIMNDQNEASATHYLMAFGEITARGNRAFGGVNFSGESLTMNLPDAGGTVDLESGHLNTKTVQVVGGASADVVNVTTGGTTIRVDDVQVFGHGGADSVNIVEDPILPNSSYHITPSTVTSSSSPGLQYDSVEALNVTASALEPPAGSDQAFILDGSFPNTTVTIDGGYGVDTLRTPNTSNTWYLTSHANSRVGGEIFRNFERLEGGSLGDSFRFAGGTSTWESIDGKDGVDGIDYSLLSAGVSVDLMAGTAFRVNIVIGVENATGTQFPDTLRGDNGVSVLIGFGGADLLDGRGGADIIDGGAGNDSLYGGAGNDLIRAGAGSDAVGAGDNDDIVYGGDGNDTMDGGNGNDALFGQGDKDVLTGAAGRDILFGGLGTDVLDGGADDDILASGNLVSDALISRVQAIRAEWTSTHSYSDRVANLRGDSANSTTWATRRNGSTFLTTLGANPTVILPAAAEDQLTGGLNNDWFFGLSAEFMDRVAGEEVNG